MKPIRIAIALVACAAVFAQSGYRIMSGSATTNKAGFTFETRLEPPSPPLAGSISGGVKLDSSSMHRYLTDSAQRKYFGYDIQIEPLPQSNTYQVTFRPLGIGADKINPNDATGWTLLPLPVYPAPQTVHGGDTIALDLFTNAATGQKIVDYIRIQNKSREVVYADSGPARDYSISDVELRLMEPRVSINGNVLPATNNFMGGVTGNAVSIYLPEHGRYFLSLVPHPELGFQKAGEIHGSSLTFTAGTDTITLECNGRIASGSAPYNLYVLFDPAWRPRNAHDRSSFLMSSGNLDALLHR
jgi:hypothetical protein